MFFSKASVLVTLAYLASFADAQDCFTDVQNVEWTAFYADLAGESYDFTKFPQDCVDIGGDLFTYSGTTTCDGEVEEHVNAPMCVPATCTANGLGPTLIPFILAPEDSCTGDYTYEGLGDSTPPSVQCTLIDMPALDGEDSSAKFEAFITARFGGDAAGGEYSALPPLCDAMEGMHYFTFSGTQTCDDATMNKDLTGVPMCLPESCTDGDEAVLADMVITVEEEIYEAIGMSCTVSGLTFDLKEEEHDSHDSHDSHDDHDSHDGHDHGDETSGAFSPAATSIITAGVAAIVTGLAVAL